MADDSPIEILNLQRMINEIKKDPMNIIFQIFFGIGILSIIVQLDVEKVSNAIPAIGPFLEITIGTLQNILFFAGGFIKSVLIVMIAMLSVFIFQGLLVGYSTASDRRTYWAIAAVVVTGILAIIVLPLLLPELFEGASASIFSIYGGP